MIITVVNFSVTGGSHDELVRKTKAYLCEFLDCTEEEIAKRVNIELKITDQTDLTDFEEDEYIAEVIAQVKNV